MLKTRIYLSFGPLKFLKKINLQQSNEAWNWFKRFVDGIFFSEILWMLFYALDTDGIRL